MNVRSGLGIFPGFWRASGLGSSSFHPFWPAFADLSSLLASFRRHFDLLAAPGRHFDLRGTPAAQGRHFDPSICSVTTFRPPGPSDFLQFFSGGSSFRRIPFAPGRPAQLLLDDIPTSPAALGRHFDRYTALGRNVDLSCAPGRHFCSSAPGRHFGLSCCSRTTFRCIQLLGDDISTCPAAPRRHFDLSCCSEITFRPIQLLWDDISTSCCSGTT